MTEVASAVVHEVLGRRIDDIDQPIVDYIINVLADDDFDFGSDGEGAFEALGELLVDSGCVDDLSECRSACSKMSEKFGKHGLVKEKPAVRSLLAPLRMYDGMDEEVAPKKKPEPVDGPLLTERDKMKLERRKRKEDRQREAQYQTHLQEMEEVKAGIPAVVVTHENSDGPTVRDIHMENFNISVGGRDLITDGCVTLSYGRHYGLIGRNGTGKTTFLRYMAMHAIDGIPKNCQILHVEQEVVGDDTSALQCVLNSDVERSQLFDEESRLLALQKEADQDGVTEKSKQEPDGGAGKDFIAQRLEEIYKRLEFIDAYSAEARAASILAGLSFSPDMQMKPTKAFSGGWRMRIALARALFIEPDMLLLDEPTNHLDLHAVLWLESYLVKWPKTFIVVSHAREFLNTVVTDILHLQNKQLTTYRGNYDTFERTREEQLKNKQKAFESNERSRAHMQSFIDKFRYNAKRASLVQSRIKVENLKVKLFEKLEQFLVDLDLESKESTNESLNVNKSGVEGMIINSTPSTAHEASIREFAEAVRAYKVLFLHSEPQLSKLGQDLVKKHFEAIHQQIMKQVHSADLLEMLRVIWTDVLLMDEVLPDAFLPDFALQYARDAVKDYICSRFGRLLMNISDSLKKFKVMPKEEIEEEYSLQAALDASKKAVIQGSVDALMDFRQLLDGNPDLFLKLRDLTVDWIQEGFQDFFRKLDGYFLSLSGKSNTGFEDVNVIEEIPGDKISAGLVLVLAQLALFIEQSAIPRITEELASFFSGGVRGGPLFVSAEICRIFRSTGESFLHLYIKMRTLKISVLLKKRFTAPNWVKHKEPREVHMFVDLLLQEFKEIRNEVKQVLPQGLNNKHRRTNSNGSTTSSRSNPLRDDKLNRSNTQRARSQLLESHLAKLFKQKMEIFTKVEHTQESVVTTLVKLSLKSLQEFVRLQTFNRSGFQQIQLDIYFLKTTLKDISDDEAAVDFLLDEVIVSTAERCLDPIHLEAPVVDRLVQAKLAKTSEQSPVP